MGSKSVGTVFGKFIEGEFMTNYEFQLTPAFCLYNGAAVLEQRGAYLKVLIDNENEDIRGRLERAFANHVEYVKKAFYYYCINPSSIVQSNSLEKTASKFKQVVNNVWLIEQFLWKNYSGISLLLSLDSLKYKQLNILNPLLSEKQIRKLWGETYPVIKYRIWINPYISVKEKAKFYLRLLRLYK